MNLCTGENDSLLLDDMEDPFSGRFLGCPSDRKSS